MEGKTTKIFIALVLAAVAFFGWTYLRLVLLQMRVGETMTELPRFPSVADLTGLKPKLQAHCEKLKYPPEQVKVEIHCEKREIGGGTTGGGVLGAQNADKWWFVVVDVYANGKKVSDQKRMENTIADTESEALEKAGIKVKK